MLINGDAGPVGSVDIGSMLAGSIKLVDGIRNPGAQISRRNFLDAFYYGGGIVVAGGRPASLRLCCSR